MPDQFVSGAGAHWHTPMVAQVTANQAVHNATYGLPRGGTYSPGGSPRRDIDDECGFPRRGQINLEDYAYLFERCSVAARVVEIAPRESWKTPPSVQEDEDASTTTTFETAWGDLAKSLRGDSWYESKEDELGNPIWQALQQVDELSGVGEFGVLLLGLAGDDDLSQPAAGVGEDGRQEGSAKNDLVYLRAYDQTKVRVDGYERDESNPRYGHPIMYSINVAGYKTEGTSSGALPDTKSVKVHWSRVLHVADIFHQSTASDVLAIPRMRPVYNELLNCRKIGGASGEFYWLHGSRDLILETHPQLGGKVRFPSNMLSEVEKFQTGLQRNLRLAGLSAKTLNPAVADPTAHLIAQVKLICIKLGVPERIFWGSERGELASSQDERGWADRMMGRQNGYITPRLIVPFIDRCIMLGVLPPPEKYGVVWPNLRESSPQEKATMASTRVEAMAKYVGGSVFGLMAPLDFLTREMDYSQEEAMEIIKAADQEEKETAEREAEEAEENEVAEEEEVEEEEGDNPFAENWNPDQPRDEQGRFGSGGGVATLDASALSDAEEFSEQADLATQVAIEAGTRMHHDIAREAHLKASDANMRVHREATTAGDQKTAERHKATAQRHVTMATRHENMDISKASLIG